MCPKGMLSTCSLTVVRRHGTYGITVAAGIVSNVRKEQSTGSPVVHKQGGWTRFRCPEDILEENSQHSAGGTVREYLDSCTSTSFLMVFLFKGR
jgi:hypothetical protein